jgi:hypothetical protein
MNIFALDADPVQAAQYANDPHCRKMVLESAQILSTATWLTDCDLAETLYGASKIYAPTHPGHPSVQWAAVSCQNWLWLKSYALALEAERLYRFPHYKPHKSAEIIRRMPTPPIPDCSLQPFALAFKSDLEYPADPIQAYRAYYRTEKSHLAQFTRRGFPPWW